MSLRMLLDGPDLHGIIKEVKAQYGQNFRVVKAEQVRTGGVAGFFAKQHYEVTVEISDPKLIARITGKPIKEPTPVAELATRSQNDQAAASAEAWAKDLLQKARELNELTVPVSAPQPQPARPRGVPLLDDEAPISNKETKSGGKLRTRLPRKKKANRTPSDRMLRATAEQQSRLKELLAQGSRIDEDVPMDDKAVAEEVPTAEVKATAPKKPRKKSAAPKGTRKKSETAATKPTRKKKPAQVPAEQVVATTDSSAETSIAPATAPTEPAFAPVSVKSEVHHVMEEPVMSQQPAPAPVMTPAPTPQTPPATAVVTEYVVPVPLVQAPSAPAAVTGVAVVQPSAPVVVAAVTPEQPAAQPVPVVEPIMQVASVPTVAEEQVAETTPATPVVPQAEVQEVPTPLVSDAHIVSDTLAPDATADLGSDEVYWRSHIADEIRQQRDKVERFYARRGTVTEEEARNLKIFELAEAIARGRDAAPATASAEETPAPVVIEAVDLDVTAEIPVVTAPLPPVVEEAPARSPLNTGEILVLVGDAHEAYQQACAIIKECERPETHVFAVAPSSVTLPLLRAEEHFRHSDAYQVVDLVTELDVPAIVVVHAPMSMLLNEAEKVRILQAVTSLNSRDVWAVVDAAWRTEAMHRWVRSLEGVSALVVTNEAGCTDPTAVTAIDIPVAFRDERSRSVPAQGVNGAAKTIRIGSLPA